MIRLDDNADTLPAGLSGTPFETVYKALRKVAASVWDVNPEVYRAGMAWGWYALHKPESLAAFRDVVTAALVSAFAPLVKDTQSNTELVDYLKRWRNYIPTAPNLAGLFDCFGVNVEILPITDEEAQSIISVDETRLAFYIAVVGMNWSRPLSLGEVYELAVRATPLGSRPFPYYDFSGRTACVATIGTAGVVYESREDSPAVPPVVPVVLPAVNNDAGAVAIYPNHADFASNSIREGRVWGWGSGSWVVSTYDATKTYATINWHAEYSFDGFHGVEISEYNGHLGITNILPFAIPRYIESVFATCDSLAVSVVTVYDAGNVEYNAFLFSANGRDYYYVLDFVQNDWTDDLSGIGYSLTPYISNTFRLAVSLDANNEPEADIFEAPGWYWWSRVPDEATKNALSAEGLWLDSGYPFGSAKYSSGGKTLALVGVFTDAAGTVLAPGWNRAFDLINNAGAAALRTPNFGYPNAVKTYRVKIIQ